jgi:hypothetical protein
MPRSLKISMARGLSLSEMRTLGAVIKNLFVGYNDMHGHIKIKPLCQTLFNHADENSCNFIARSVMYGSRACHQLKRKSILKDFLAVRGQKDEKRLCEALFRYAFW